jgi:hypothetical protein
MEESAGSFQNVPILGLFELIDSSLSVWLDEIEQ